MATVDKGTISMIKFNALATQVNYIQATRKLVDQFIGMGRFAEAQKEMTLLVEAQQRLNDLYDRMSAEPTEAPKTAVVEEVVTETPVKQPIVQVFYERGYKWTVDIKGSDESIECDLNKAEAVSLAKRVAARIGAKLEIQTLTREEKKAAFVDRWDHAKATGQTALKFR
jgi:hypothetical protein